MQHQHQEDQHWMQRAIALAALAARRDEVPVGAVVVLDGRLVGQGYNLRETMQDPTAHAEMLALSEAARNVGFWRLDGCTLYVTLEPCPMCAGALVNARVKRLVFGCSDPKAGAAGTLLDIPRDPRLNHRLEVAAGVQAEQAADLLRRFFAAKRGPKAAPGMAKGSQR